MHRYLTLFAAIFFLLGHAVSAQTLSPLNIGSGETATTLEVRVAQPAIIEGVAQTDGSVAALGDGVLLDMGEELVIAVSSVGASVTLDLVLLSPNGTILTIVRNAAPGSQNAVEFSARTAAILQLAGGEARTLGLVPGGTVAHEILSNLDEDGE